jgi:hypothetical protein
MLTMETILMVEQKLQNTHMKNSQLRIVSSGAALLGPSLSVEYKMANEF